MVYCGLFSGKAAITDDGPQIAVPFGKYLLIKRLAVGGMAELFLAQDAPEEPLVVIKRILPYLSSEPEFVRMFLDEARIAAQLHHPNIVQVHELGKLDESIFIAMEYVEGVDLRKLLQQEQKDGGAIPYHIAARLVAEVCAGLHYAHNCVGVDGRVMEIVHRDVSPQNVMVGYDGRVKLVDFGIARANSFMERSNPGVLKGKFLYLSPEQVLQQPLDHRADLFAIGTLLYEITTGKSPFQRNSAEAVLYAIRHEPPAAPQLLKSDYPKELSIIVAKCLAKDREQRYQQADEIRRDLEIFLELNPTGPERVADYAQALFGDEDERTILNIPVLKGTSQATLIAPPVLAPPPTRRISEPRSFPPVPSETSRTDELSATNPEARTLPPLPPPLPPRGPRSNPPLPRRVLPPAPPPEPEPSFVEEGEPTGIERFGHEEGEMTLERADTGEQPTIPPGQSIISPPVPKRPGLSPAGAPGEGTGGIFEVTASTTHKQPRPIPVTALLIVALVVFVLASIAVLAWRVRRHSAPLAQTASVPTAPTPSTSNGTAPPFPTVPEPPPLEDVLFRTSHGAVVSFEGHVLAPGELVHVPAGTLHYRLHCPGRPSAPQKVEVAPKSSKVQAFEVSCPR